MKCTNYFNNGARGLQFAIGVDYKSLTVAIVNDSSSWKILVFVHQDGVRKPAACKASRSKTAPSLPYIIMASRMSEKVAVRLRFRKHTNIYDNRYLAGLTGYPPVNLAYLLRLLFRQSSFLFFPERYTSLLGALNQVSILRELVHQ
jgi:hypothetical protein